MERISHQLPMVHVLIQPEESEVELACYKIKSVLSLLKALKIRPGSAIVARGRELLTPDREVFPGDDLLVRRVTSAG